MHFDTMKMLYSNFLTKVILFNCLAFTSRGNTYTVSKVKETSYGHHIGSHLARSFIDCYISCSNVGTCRSVTYAMMSHKCDLNGKAVPIEFFTCSSAVCDDGQIVLYVVKDVACMSTIRYECTSDTGCVDENSHCRDGICKCTPGLHHDPNTCSCVTECDTYGDTFQVDLNQYIYLSNREILYDPITLTECLHRCISETAFVCRSVEYVSEDRSMCRLQVVTSIESTVKSKNFTNLYTRDCAHNDY